MINAFLNAQLWWLLKGCVCAQLLSPVQLFVTPWTVACQASLYMGFFRQEYWSGVAISSSRASPFLRLPAQNKVQMKLLSSLRTIVILLGSQILTDDVMTQKKTQNRQPIISFLWVSHLRQQAWDQLHFGHGFAEHSGSSVAGSPPQLSLEGWVSFFTNWSWKNVCLCFKICLKFKTHDLLFLFPVVAESKDQVFQPSTVVSLEGAVAEISCNHSISNVYGYFCYLHFPGFAPRLLIKGSRPSQQGRYNMTYKRFSLSLLILQVQTADAGVYYCALRYTEAGNSWRAEQKQGEVTAFAGCGRKMNNNCFPSDSQFSIPQAFPFALSEKTFESKHYI